MDCHCCYIIVPQDLSFQHMWEIFSVGEREHQLGMALHSLLPFSFVDYEHPHLSQTDTYTVRFMVEQMPEGTPCQMEEVYAYFHALELLGLIEQYECTASFTVPSWNEIDPQMLAPYSSLFL